VGFIGRGETGNIESHETSDEVRLYRTIQSARLPQHRLKVTYDMRELEGGAFRDEGDSEIRGVSDECFFLFVSVDDSLSSRQDVICDVSILST